MFKEQNGKVGVDAVGKKVVTGAWPSRLKTQKRPSFEREKERERGKSG